MNGEDKNTGVDEYRRAEEDKSKDLSAQQQDDRAEPGDIPPGAAATTRDDPDR